VEVSCDVSSQNVLVTGVANRAKPTANNFDCIRKSIKFAPKLSFKVRKCPTFAGTEKMAVILMMMIMTTALA